jgi:hypothetical protein
VFSPECECMCLSLMWLAAEDAIKGGVRAGWRRRREDRVGEGGRRARIEDGRGWR